MSNSPLIDGTLLTNNCSKPRNHSIDTITPHYMYWYTSAKTCCESFVPSSRQASANYCIGKDGEIWLNVDERNRAWTSGSGANDNRAVTIECANYMENANGHVLGQLPQKTWDSLVALCADICMRYNKTKLVYTGRASWDTLKSHQMLLTMHKWFQATSCPGPWLSVQFNRLAAEVNAILGGGSAPVSKPENNTHGGKLVVDGWGGYNTVLDMQHALGTYEDGVISGQWSGNKDWHWAMVAVDYGYSKAGSAMVMELQKRIGAGEDGQWGYETSGLLQEFLTRKGCPCDVDHLFGNASVTMLQRYLNDGGGF